MWVSFLEPQPNLKKDRQSTPHDCLFLQLDSKMEVFDAKANSIKSITIKSIYSVVNVYLLSIELSIKSNSAVPPARTNSLLVKSSLVEDSEDGIASDR